MTALYDSAFQAVLRLKFGIDAAQKHDDCALIYNALYRLRDLEAEIESLRVEASAYRSGMDINAEKTKKTPTIDWSDIPAKP